MRYNVQKANPIEIAEQPAGSVEALDPYSAPVAGQSLTERTGKHTFEKPAKFSDVDDAIMFVIQKIEENQQMKETHLEQLASGVPIEYIVNTISHIGFQEGLWNPDVAELIKPSLAMYFILMGLEEEVPLVLFNPQGQDPSKMSEGDIMRNMGKLNPQGYDVMRTRMQGLDQPEPEPEGFLAAMPEGEMMEEPIPDEQMMENIPQEGLV